VVGGCLYVLPDRFADHAVLYRIDAVSFLLRPQRALLDVRWRNRGVFRMLPRDFAG
jgi:hypothetical protein